MSNNERISKKKKVKEKQLARNNLKGEFDILNMLMCFHAGS